VTLQAYPPRLSDTLLEPEREDVVMKPDSTILVGVSGSPASLAALRWAGDEAERRECQLRILLIWEREQRASYARQVGLGDLTDRPATAWRVLTTAVHAVLGPGPWRNTTVEAVEGDAERALVAASADADLLVLGSGAAGVIGPIVRTCLTEAYCPVVVVGRRATPVRGFDSAENPAAGHAASRPESGRVPQPAGI
jgi:nucleotide-binding universal stress UspA family protein